MCIASRELSDFDELILCNSAEVLPCAAGRPVDIQIHFLGLGTEANVLFQWIPAERAHLTHRSVN